MCVKQVVEVAIILRLITIRFPEPEIGVIIRSMKRSNIQNKGASARGQGEDRINEGVVVVVIFHTFSIRAIVGTVNIKVTQCLDYASSGSQEDQRARPCWR